MKTVIALQDQTLFDIALQEMGSIEGVFDILASNAFLRLDMAIAAGTKILVPETVINASVVDYYTRNNIKPVSGLGEEISINQDDMIQIKQIVAYDASGGNKSFDGVRLSNLGDELSVQINYVSLTGAVTLYVEQSLDGIAFSPIANASAVLDDAKVTYTFNISGLVTDFTRIRLEAAGATGTINEILWRV